MNEIVTPFPVSPESIKSTTSREPFMIGRKEDAKILSQEDLMTSLEAAKVFNGIVNKTGKPDFELLTALGHEMSKYLASIDVNGQLTEVQRKALIQMNKFYQVVWGDQWDSTKRGFFSEYAVLRSLVDVGLDQEQTPFDVYYPTLKEDAYDGVDGWINPDSSTEESWIPIQVKTVPFEFEQPRRIVHGFSSSQDLDAIVKILRASTVPIERVESVKNSGGRMLNRFAKYGVSKGMLVILPSPESRMAGEPYFNSETGSPSEILYNRLMQEIQL